jgi:hypothetical protein
MNKLKKFIFILISCTCLIYIWYYKIESADSLYYEFPGANGITSIAIPERIVKHKDCAKLKAWMQDKTPPELIMEIPDCPWDKKGLVGVFNISGTQFCIPRSYLNIEKYKLSGNVDELHLEFDFNTLEPVDRQLIIEGKYNASNYIDIVIKKNPQRDKCTSNQSCQQLYWSELVGLLERYSGQPSDDIIKLSLIKKNFHGIDLDYYIFDNWKRACIVSAIARQEKANEICEDKSPNLFLSSTDDPSNPSLWIHCVDGRDYMDFRSDKYICKIRHYYNDSNIIVDMYFDQDIYISRYRDLLRKIETLLNRFQTSYYCQSQTP